MHQTTKHKTGQVTNYIPGDLLQLVLRDIFCETAWSCGNMHARDLDFDLSSFNGVPCSITWGCRGLLTFFGLFELAKERTPVTSRRSAECASVCSGSLTAEPPILELQLRLPQITWLMLSAVDSEGISVWGLDSNLYNNVLEIET